MSNAMPAADAYDVQLQRLATKEDLQLLSTELRGEMAELRGEMALIRWMAGPSLIGTMATVVGMVALMIKNFA